MIFSNDAIKVNVIDCVDELDDPEFVNSVMSQIQMKVQIHLENSPEYFKNANLTIRLQKCMTRFYLHEVRWNITTEASGTINQKDFTVCLNQKGQNMKVERESVSLSQGLYPA